MLLESCFLLFVFFLIFSSFSFNDFFLYGAVANMLPIIVNELNCDFKNYDCPLPHTGPPTINQYMQQPSSFNR